MKIMTDQNQNQNNGDQNDVKLYAGKFKTVEELEAGYKNSLPTFQENETLKKQLDEVTKVPDTYMNPADVQIEANRVTDIQARAKETGMTQAQYEKFLRGDKARTEKHQQAFDAAKKEVGEETINILQDYVNKNYPKEIADNMVRTFIANKDARQAALNHRDKLLSNQVPGMNNVSAGGGYTVTQEDVNKAYAAKENRNSDPRNREKARQHYMNLIAAQAAQKAG
jgi:hypothetical protein